MYKSTDDGGLGNAAPFTTFGEDERSSDPLAVEKCTNGWKAERPAYPGTSQPSQARHSKMILVQHC